MSESGRFWVKSPKTGKVYCIEPIDSRGKDWGSVDPVTKELVYKKGWKKYTGGIAPEESIITSANGFTNIRELPAGVSPLDYIEKLEEKDAIP